jgi:processive 1,2-diacylglycerol beta-glucosyltransferase
MDVDRSGGEEDRRKPKIINVRRRAISVRSRSYSCVDRADLIVINPGRLTTSEAMALGKPLFIVNPIPGQESANGAFLLERGAASRVSAESARRAVALGIRGFVGR